MLCQCRLDGFEQTVRSSQATAQCGFLDRCAKAVSCDGNPEREARLNPLLDCLEGIDPAELVTFGDETWVQTSHVEADDITSVEHLVEVLTAREAVTMTPLSVHCCDVEHPPHRGEQTHRYLPRSEEAELRSKP